MYQWPGDRQPMRGKTRPPPEPRMHVGTTFGSQSALLAATNSVVKATPYWMKGLLAPPNPGGLAGSTGASVPSAWDGEATHTTSIEAETDARGPRDRRAFDVIGANIAQLVDSVRAVRVSEPWSRECGSDLPERTMEIFLDKRAVRQIRLSAQDAIEEGDTETLREDILEAFTEEQVEEIERRLDSGDFFEFLTDMLDEWSGDDVEELFELLDAQLGDVGVDVKFEKKPAAAAEDDEAKEDEEEEFDDEDLDEDEDDEEEEEEDEDE
jgi:hypothetical protein